MLGPRSQGHGFNLCHDHFVLPWERCLPHISSPHPCFKGAPELREGIKGITGEETATAIVRPCGMSPMTLLVVGFFFEPDLFDCVHAHDVEKYCIIT